MARLDGMSRHFDCLGIQVPRPLGGPGLLTGAQQPTVQKPRLATGCRVQGLQVPQRLTTLYLALGRDVCTSIHSEVPYSQGCGCVRK